VRNRDNKEKSIVKHHCGSYQVQVWFNGKTKYVGLYPTIEEAIIKRDEFLKKNNITNTSTTYQSHYIDNKDMLYEMIVSQAQGKLSEKLLRMFMKIVKGVSKKFRYNNEEDRYDCECYCYEVIIKNWMMFDLDKYENVFAWGTQIVKNGFAMQFKILQKTRLNTISLDYTDDEGKKMINI
jgi:hypothetical protein